MSFKYTENHHSSSLAEKVAAMMFCIVQHCSRGQRKQRLFVRWLSQHRIHKAWTVPPRSACSWTEKEASSYKCAPHMAGGFVCTGLGCCRRNMYPGSRMGGEQQRRTKGNTRHQTSTLTRNPNPNPRQYCLLGECTKQCIYMVTSPASSS